MNDCAEARFELSVNRRSFLFGRALRSLFVVIACLLAGNFCSSSHAREAELYEQEPFNYSAATPRDGMGLLQKQIVSGELKSGATDRKVVEALLRSLKIPSESQLLVFSRTSFQRERIRPEHPRALYFNDQCYVGWVPGGIVEIRRLILCSAPSFTHSILPP